MQHHVTARLSGQPLQCYHLCSSLFLSFFKLWPSSELEHTNTHEHTHTRQERQASSMNQRQRTFCVLNSSISTYLNIVFKDLRNRRQEPQVALYRRQLQCKKIIPQQGESLAARMKHILQHENIMSPQNPPVPAHSSATIVKCSIRKLLHI